MLFAMADPCLKKNFAQSELGEINDHTTPGCRQIWRFGDASGGAWRLRNHQ
jgi:hypothetical protein